MSEVRTALGVSQYHAMASVGAVTNVCLSM